MVKLDILISFKEHGDNPEEEYKNFDHVSRELELKVKKKNLIDSSDRLTNFVTGDKRNLKNELICTSLVWMNFISYQNKFMILKIICEITFLNSCLVCFFVIQYSIVVLEYTNETDKLSAIPIKLSWDISKITTPKRISWH